MEKPGCVEGVSGNSFCAQGRKRGRAAGEEDSLKQQQPGEFHSRQGFSKQGLFPGRAERAHMD